MNEGNEFYFGDDETDFHRCFYLLLLLLLISKQPSLLKLKALIVQKVNIPRRRPRQRISPRKKTFLKELYQQEICILHRVFSDHFEPFVTGRKTDEKQKSFYSSRSSA